MRTRLILILALCAGAAFAAGRACYCKYCGFRAGDIRFLTSGKCLRHPDGPFAGRHALYEGSEKAEYFCKFCGRKAGDLRSLTAGKCQRHPKGPFKGCHVPAL